MSKREFVLVTDDGRFWTGRNWVAEYPDARVFSTRAMANGERARIAPPDAAIDVVEDYGKMTERRF